MSLRLVSTLRHGGIAVIPTDTLYGVVARALDTKAVRRLYTLRRKTPRKPFIILISSMKELAAFGVRPNAAVARFLKRVWPAKVSVILPCPHRRFAYLHRGTKRLAFRAPKPQWLRTLLRKTGPLAAPSANREGKRPAETSAEARVYFGSSVDAYVNAGRPLRGKPSTLVSFAGALPKILRQGRVRVPV